MFHTHTANIRAELSGTGELTTDKKGRAIAQIKTVNVKTKIGDATGTATNTDRNRQNERISEYRFYNIQRASTVAIIFLFIFHTAETAVSFYTNNRRQILDIAAPIAEEIATEFVTQIGNQILSAVLLDEILPDN